MRKGIFLIYEKVAIHTAVAVKPPQVVTSEEVEHRLKPVYDRLRLPYGRLELMTGIKERRFWEPRTRSSTVAAEAGRRALEISGFAPEQIGVLIHASVCRDFLEPATASIVHEKLNLPQGAGFFDLGNACLGVINGVVMIANMIELGTIQAGLVVSGEVAEGLYEATIQEILKKKNPTRGFIKQHFASLTIGSGATAVLVVRSDLAPHRLIGGIVRSDTSANHLCREDTTKPPSAAGPLMATDSEGLLHAGCQLAKETWELTKQELGWKNSTPDHIFTHQVGSAHTRLIFETLKLNTAKNFSTLQYMGNTGSAALPSAFAIGIEEKQIAEGEKIALLGIGSGLSSLILGVEW